MKSNNKCPASHRFNIAGLILVLGLAMTPFAQADEISVPLYKPSNFHSVHYELKDHYVAGIERRRFGGDIKVIGWKTGEGAYFGRTRVAGKYALGFVFGDDKTVYGITHRGIRVTRYF